MRQVPGFRSRTWWKMVLGVVGYLSIASLVISGNLVPGLFILTTVLFVADGWGVRSSVLAVSTRRVKPAGRVCNLCGRRFGRFEFLFDPTSKEDGHYFHRSCLWAYRAQKERRERERVEAAESSLRDKLVCSPKDPLPYLELARHLLRQAEIELEGTTMKREFGRGFEELVVLGCGGECLDLPEYGVNCLRDVPKKVRDLVKRQLDQFDGGIRSGTIAVDTPQEWQGNTEWMGNSSLLEAYIAELRGDLEPRDVYEHRREALTEAADCFFKAIALGIPDAFLSGCAKLEYEKLLLVGHLPGSGHYAREAEKDLRNHLRADPDHVASLEKLAEAISIYESNERVREQRLQSVNARIKEARVRQQLGATPLPGLRPPGAPESPYPDNWNELAESIRKRDGYRCTQCGASEVELHIHHVVPLSKGGSNGPDNLVTLCQSCHSEIHPRMGSPALSLPAQRQPRKRRFRVTRQDQS